MPLAVRRRAVSCARSDALQKNAPGSKPEGHTKSEYTATTRCARTHRYTRVRCTTIRSRTLFLTYQDPPRPSLCGPSTASPQVSRGNPKTKKRKDKQSDLG